MRLEARLSSHIHDFNESDRDIDPLGRDADGMPKWATSRRAADETRASTSTMEHEPLLLLLPLCLWLALSLRMVGITRALCRYSEMYIHCFAQKQLSLSPHSSKIRRMPTL